ncbi:RHS repeat-associated core domain-containing protein [Nonomuraea sp. 3N208]|uniref:RHS repeat-associated core domain-containing protein n=1 Tax=Nonomuraea sp. 3N208 TaxID=3457421 RepID=UPI003FD1438A
MEHGGGELGGAGFVAVGQRVEQFLRADRRPRVYAVARRARWWNQRARAWRRRRQAAITDSGGAVQAKYARDPGGGLLGLKEGTGAAVAALNDLHGDLVATFTTSLQTSTAYDPFGTVTAQTGTKTQLGYQGEYTDPDTGKVNMHARWYQPGTGTFTSRDTATLNPSPSVQANRYTYANASPLTGTDPTGHATASIGSSSYTPGVDYQSAIDIYAQHGIVSGGGSSGGGGYCIGACGMYGGGGGPIACLAEFVGDCGAANPGADWIRFIQLEFEKNFWLGQDEIERLGWEYMPNGRPVDQPNFWFASEKVQNDYMARWLPELDGDSLAVLWVSVGGLESFNAMQKAQTYSPDDVRLRGWKKMLQASSENIGSARFARGDAGPPGPGTREARKYYSLYSALVSHAQAIADAAKEFGVDKRALSAVLIYEGLFLETQISKIGAGEYSYWKEAKGASLGISQLEVYKAKHLLKKYYTGKKVNGVYAENMTDKQIANLLIYNDGWSIRLAAARMAHLKDTYYIYEGPLRSGREAATRPINDWEAAIAYCGCAASNAKQFARWAQSGYSSAELVRMHYNNKNIDAAMDRRRWMIGVGREIVDSYWESVGM